MLDGFTVLRGNAKQRLPKYCAVVKGVWAACLAGQPTAAITACCSARSYLRQALKAKQSQPKIKQIPPNGRKYTVLLELKSLKM